MLPGVHRRLAIVSRRSPGSGNLAQVTLDRRTFLKAGAVVGAAAAVPLQPVRALADAGRRPADVGPRRGRAPDSCRLAR
jgi:hypothetical protein